MFGDKKRFRALIGRAFGTNPLEGWSYYNGENRLDRIRRFHDGLSKVREDKWSVDETTWSDLEMDRVFLRVNHTNCFMGEQTLYHRMRTLDKGLDPAAREAQERRIGVLEADPELRTDIETELQLVGKTDDSYYLGDFLLNSTEFTLGSSLVYHLLQAALAVALVLAIVLDSVYLITAAAAIALVNLVIYMRVKSKYEVLFTSLIEFKKVFDFVKWLDRKDRTKPLVTDEARAALKSLKKMTWVIAGMNNRRRGAMTGDVLAMIREYIWGALLIDVSMFNHMMRITEDKQKEVLALLEFAGQMDSDIAIMSFRHSVKQWCYPDFVVENAVDETGEHAGERAGERAGECAGECVGECAGESRLSVTGVAHPLIKDPVLNDFSLSSKAVITGSNASGKSTFMKSIAINCILAQSINTCTAEHFSLQPMMVVTCMALRDDILTGESYYFREAKCLKRMLDLVDVESRVLVVVDEILKGTNTKERIAASKAILEYIGKRDCLTLVATHDNELTENPLYENYHFRNEIVNDDIVFDYLIHSGKSTQSNAIALLDHLGYPPEVVEKARQNVK